MNKKEEIKLCPYNDSHCISAKKYPMHVTNCRKLYPNAPVIVCENCKEHVHEQKLQIHSTFLCPNRQPVDSSSTQPSSMSR